MLLCLRRARSARQAVGETPGQVGRRRDERGCWEVGPSQVPEQSRWRSHRMQHLSLFSLSLSLSPSSLSLLPSHPSSSSPIYVLGLPVVPEGFVSPHWWHTGPKRLPILGITPPGWVGLGALLQEAAGMD